MNNEEYEKIIKKINNGKEKGYIVEKGTLFKVKDKKKLRIIRDYEYKTLMYVMHDSEISAHFEIEATTKKIKEKYYWPNMEEMIKKYVKTCWKCQSRGKTNWKNELHLIEVKEPFETIGIDIVGSLEVTEKGNRYIVVV